jgi:hypothetical protein
MQSDDYSPGGRVDKQGDAKLAKGSFAEAVNLMKPRSRSIGFSRRRLGLIYDETERSAQRLHHWLPLALNQWEAGRK